MLLTADCFGARCEEIVFNLKLDKALAEKHAETIAKIRGTSPVALGDEDQLTIKYTLHATYWKVDKALGAIETLLDEPGVVQAGNIEELKHGRCLLLEVCRKLDRIIERIDEPDSSRNP